MWTNRATWRRASRWSDGRARGATSTRRGCLPISAIIDLHHPAPPPGSLEERVYTMVLAEPDDDALLSPIQWTRGNRVPFVMSCGDADSERVRRSNRRLHALLSRQPRV